MKISRSLFVLLLLLFASCDFILKDKGEPEIGTVVTDGSTEIVVLEDDDDLPYHLRCWRCAFLFVYWISACLYIGFLLVCLLGFGFGLTLYKAL